MSVIMWPSERECVLVFYHSIPLPLKGSEFDWLNDPTCDASAVCTCSVQFLCDSLKLLDTWRDWSDLFTVLKRVGHAVWAQHVHTCEGPIVPWVSRGVVEVRGQLHSSRSANRRPALTVSNTTQEDCGNVSRSLIWWSLACWCFSWLWIFHDVIDSLQHRPRRKFGEFIGCFSFVLPILMFLVFVL